MNAVPATAPAMPILVMPFLLSISHDLGLWNCARREIGINGSRYPSS